MKIRVEAVAVAVVLSVINLGCQKKTISSDDLNTKNRVTAGNPAADQPIQNKGVKMTVMGQETLKNKIAAQSLQRIGSPAAAEFLTELSEKNTAGAAFMESDEPQPMIKKERPAESLVLSFPAELIGEQSIFGGVITRVSDEKNETLGRLKLTDITPIHVRSKIIQPGSSKAALAFFGCTEHCSEASKLSEVARIPIQAVDTDQKRVILDLATLGDQLNLIEMLDPNGEYTQLQTKSASTVSFDFTASTLVFDIETKMVPIDSPPDDPSVKETVLTARWYIKLGSAFDPAFKPRTPTTGVGYFTTDRGAETRITRFSLNQIDGTPSVKYYIKNVPTEHQPAFAKAFDLWNEKFKTLLGRELLAYEFISPTDPRNALLVPGDVRYNILEWDLVNKAPYGGLGPSIANQFSGEILSANVLIQGPTIIGLYKDWFKVVEKANELRSTGLIGQAEELERNFESKLETLVTTRSSRTYELSLGKIAFRIPSQLPSLEDPLMQRNDFEDLPQGVTFETYMPGYFTDIVAHELGHNLGLRHNFRGNLGATDSTSVGGVSRSVMEYLGRPFRYLDLIGSYDEMAIQYGYAGIMPQFLDQFCTDEDAAGPGAGASNSAECSSSDATADPYSYLESRLAKILRLLTAAGEKRIPTWAPEDMGNEITQTVSGLLSYATTTLANSNLLTHFFGKLDRPATGDLVKGYVLARVKSAICDPALAAEAEIKESPEAKAKTLSNISGLRLKAQTLKLQFPQLKDESLDCGS